MACSGSFPGKVVVGCRVTFSGTPAIRTSPLEETFI